MTAVINALRGALIGIAEIVPGVSGGTIALVVGIYEDLIDSAGHVITSGRLFISGKTREARKTIRLAKWSLVVPALIGMALAVIIAAKFLEPLVADHEIGSRALFAGLIIASLSVPIRMVSPWRPQEIAVLIVAATAAILLTSLPAANNSDPSLIIVGAVAALAVCALVLPGVSGSFIMLIFGIYSATLAALNSRDWPYIGTFILGAAIGLIFFVKLLQYLLHHHEKNTLAVMTGLMVGSLRALWPWQASDRSLLAPDDQWWGAALLALVGIAVVSILLWVERREKLPHRDQAEH